MMLKSARDASLGGGIFDSQRDSSSTWSSWISQVALELARNGGFGFGKMSRAARSAHATERRAAPAPEQGAVRRPRRASLTRPHRKRRRSTALPRRSERRDGGLSVCVAARALPRSAACRRRQKRQSRHRREFVTRLLPEANAAAEALGIEPRLAARASRARDRLGSRRAAARTAIRTTTCSASRPARRGDGASRRAVDARARGRRDGAASASSFRAYDSTADSFTRLRGPDRTARRYAARSSTLTNPEAYVRAVTEAGYATDPSYAEKWLAIYHGDRSAARSS